MTLPILLSLSLSLACTTLSSLYHLWIREAGRLSKYLSLYTLLTRAREYLLLLLHYYYFSIIAHYAS